MSESEIWPANSTSSVRGSPSASAVDLPQALGQGEEVAHGLRRLGGADVDGEGHELAGQGQAHLLGDGVAGLVLGLAGLAPRWGVTTTWGRSNSGGVGGGLVREDVDGGAAHVADADGLGEGVLVDDPASGDVDDADARLGPRQQVLVDEADGLGRLGDVEGHEVGHLDQPLERQEVDAQVLGPLRRHERVVRHQLHAEAEGALRHQLADAAQADDAEGLAGQLDALPLRPLPAAGDQRGVGLGHVAGLGEQHGHGVLGGGEDVGLGGVDDHDATRGGGLDVDVVETDAGPAHHHQVCPGLDHLA